jgi:hypothetical protein
MYYVHILTAAMGFLNTHSARYSRRFRRAVVKDDGDNLQYRFMGIAGIL